MDSKHNGPVIQSCDGLFAIGQDKLLNKQLYDRSFFMQILVL